MSPRYQYQRLHRAAAAEPTLSGYAAYPNAHVATPGIAPSPDQHRTSILIGLTIVGLSILSLIGVFAWWMQKYRRRARNAESESDSDSDPDPDLELQLAAAQEAKKKNGAKGETGDAEGESTEAGEGGEKEGVEVRGERKGKGEAEEMKDEVGKAGEVNGKKPNETAKGKKSKAKKDDDQICELKQLNVSVEEKGAALKVLD